MKKINLSMQHWNGCQMCAIDIETTGLDADFHEITEICILPLDSNLLVRKDVLPFSLKIIPSSPERIDLEALKITKKKFRDVLSQGHPIDTAADLLEYWLEKLNLPLNKGGVYRCKIIPLGHNYQFDRAFIIKWLGQAFYDEWFHYLYRDTMLSALYLNDRAAMHAMPVAYPKVNLQYLASCLEVGSRKFHDAVSDCITTAEVYRQLIKQGAIG